MSTRALSSWSPSFLIAVSVAALAFAGVTCAEPHSEPPVRNGGGAPPRVTGAAGASVEGEGERDARAARDRARTDRSSRKTPRAQAKKPEQVLRTGSHGPKVRGLQRALELLGYWTGGSDGTYGLLTEQAVLAFQGVEGLQRDGAAGPQTLGALRAAARPSPRSKSGDLIEIDKERGVLLVVRGGATQWAFHTSTGTEQPYAHPSGQTFMADTPEGRWAISWAFDGWREGPLGEMWRPRYFHNDGIAIHGYASVPAYPASHGCARVSIPAMNFIWEGNLAAYGSPVWVY